MMPGLVDLGHWALSSTVQTGVIVGVLAGLGGALGRYLSPRWVAALWLLVLMRLVVPWSPGAPAGLHCIWPTRIGQFGHGFSPVWPLRIPQNGH